MINKKSLVAALLCTAIATTAKADFYLKPTVGVGLCNARTTNFFVPYTNNGFTGCYMGQVTAGYKFGHLRVEAGIGYMTSGFMEKDILFTTSTGPNATTYVAKRKYVYEHLIIPLRAAYRIGISKRLSIVPHAGADISYNLGTKSKFITDAPTVTKKYVRADGEFFSKYYNRVGIWANAGADVELKLVNKLSIVAGPTFRYMINNLVVDNTPVFDPKQNNYIISLEAGVLLSL